jgi:hypothetical protein
MAAICSVVKPPTFFDVLELPVTVRMVAALLGLAVSRVIRSKRAAARRPGRRSSLPLATSENSATSVQPRAGH